MENFRADRDLSLAEEGSCLMNGPDRPFTWHGVAGEASAVIADGASLDAESLLLTQVAYC